MTAPDRRQLAPRAGADKPFPYIGLIILAGAIFVCVTSEFLPTGLLPELAAGLGVPESRIGLLVTAYAGTVVLSAPLLTSLTRKLPRKALIIVVLCVFAVTNVVVALAPNYTVVVIARVVGGLAHGLFWSVVGAYASYLVPKHQLARAVAITSAGATTAFVLGIPLGTALGHALGWQLAFVVMAVAIAVLTVLVVLFLPPVTHVEDLRTGEIRLPARRDASVFGVVVICLITATLMVGHYLFYTFIVPFYTTVAGFDDDSVSVLLFLYGGAGAIGLLLVGLIAARYPRASLAVSFAVAAAAVLVIGLFPEVTWLVIAAIVVWGIAFGGGPALLQTRMLHTASVRIRDLASAWFTVSFNVGIGGGALIGGLIYDGFGLGVLPFIEAAVIAGAVVLILVSDRMLHRRRVAATAPAARAHPA